MPLRPDLPPALRNTALFGQIQRGHAGEQRPADTPREIWGGRNVVNWRPVLAL